MRGPAESDNRAEDQACRISIAAGRHTNTGSSVASRRTARACEVPRRPKGGGAACMTPFVRAWKRPVNSCRTNEPKRGGNQKICRVGMEARQILFTLRCLGRIEMFRVRRRVERGKHLFGRCPSKLGIPDSRNIGSYCGSVIPRTSCLPRPNLIHTTSQINCFQELSVNTVQSLVSSLAASRRGTRECRSPNAFMRPASNSWLPNL